MASHTEKGRSKKFQTEIAMMHPQHSEGHGASWERWFQGSLNMWEGVEEDC